MPAADQRTVADIGEQLLRLYVLRAQACGPEDWHRLRALEAQIGMDGRNALVLGQIDRAV
jgi:hypothetical protein